ncbi:MAG: MBL fold metallo-hydrolase, partial [Bacillota bacterium]
AGAARLTVLGRCSPFPGTGGHCPGYLLEAEGVRVLVECGPGTLTRLAGRLKPGPGPAPTTVSPFAGLDALVVSHLHADHFSEALSLRYAIANDIRGGFRRGLLPVYGPAGPAAERDIIAYPKAFDLGTIGEDTPLTVGPFHFEFRRTDHPYDCLAMRIRAGRSTVVYTADTAWDDKLLAWAAAAGGPDLLLAEASLQDAHAHLRSLGHLTAREAGRFARLCGARRTLLVHLYPEFDFEVSRREAVEGYREAAGEAADGTAGAQGAEPTIPGEGDSFPA